MREDYNIVIVTFARRVPPYGIWEYFLALSEISPLYLQRSYPGHKESRQDGCDLAALGLGFQVAVNNTEAGERERQE